MPRDFKNLSDKALERVMLDVMTCMGDSPGRGLNAALMSNLSTLLEEEFDQSFPPRTEKIKEEG
jgi:hypothetical protein